MAGHGYNALRKHLDYIQRDGTDERGDRAKAYGQGVEDLDRIDVNQEGLERDQKTAMKDFAATCKNCLLYTSPSPRDLSTSRMPSSA